MKNLICRLFGHKMKPRATGSGGDVEVLPQVCTRCGWDNVLSPILED